MGRLGCTLWESWFANRLGNLVVKGYKGVIVGLQKKFSMLHNSTVERGTGDIYPYITLT